jgi:hypothetical protein
MKEYTNQEKNATWLHHSQSHVRYHSANESMLSCSNLILSNSLSFHHRSRNYDQLINDFLNHLKENSNHDKQKVVK